MWTEKDQSDLNCFNLYVLFQETLLFTRSSRLEQERRSGRVRGVFIFGECTYMLALSDWLYWTLGVWQILFWGPGMKADCSERGTHLHVCLSETLRDVCHHFLFLAALPSPWHHSTLCRRQTAPWEDCPWSFSCLCDMAGFVFSAWLFFPSQASNFETFVLQTA